MKRKSGKLIYHLPMLILSVKPFNKTTILLKALEEAVKSVLKADNNVSFTSKFNEYMLRIV
jgi:hypothetical protein